MPTTIKVSSEAFNEFAGAMEKIGRKQGVNAGQITLEKDDLIIDPVDWRAATVRKDCLIEAVKICSNRLDEDVIKMAEKMFDFVLTFKKD